MNTEYGVGQPDAEGAEATQKAQSFLRAVIAC